MAKVALPAVPVGRNLGPGAPPSSPTYLSGFIMTEFLLLWVAVSGLVAYWAQNRGRSAGQFFLIALLASPLIAGLILTMQDKRRSKRKFQSLDASAHGKIECPYCDARVKQHALVCHACGRDLQRFQMLRNQRMRAAARLGNA